MEKSRSVLKIFNLVYLEAAPGGVLLKNVFLKILQISQEKYLCSSLFLIKLQALSPQVCNFIKKRLQHRCFPMKFGKFLRTCIFEEH